MLDEVTLRSVVSFDRYGLTSQPLRELLYQSACEVVFIVSAGPVLVTLWMEHGGPQVLPVAHRQTNSPPRA